MRFILIISCILKIKSRNTIVKGGNLDEVFEGVLVGSLLTVGATWMYNGGMQKMMLAR